MLDAVAVSAEHNTLVDLIEDILEWVVVDQSCNVAVLDRRINMMKLQRTMVAEAALGTRQCLLVPD